MTMPLSIHKTVLCCGLALAAVPAAFGQSYTNNGVQYAIVPALPGDQIRPQLGLNASGGYAVWEDNATDGRGQGISMQALDNNLSAVGSHFRVNQIGAGDQELPRVALLDNGGGVVVWQGGRRGFQKIYARFLGAAGRTNFWLGGDVLVNTFTNHFQINPVVATLANGNVVVVWASYNQFSANSMQDVYAQMFSPTGQKAGGEFLVNQFTSFNQRTPALAALAGGGFVVAWVSEQQQSGSVDSVDSNYLYTNSVAAKPSVDIYARLYDASGSPAAGEFLVDAGTNVCANPSIAVASDGNFMVAWSAHDSSVFNNGWDIYARTFSSTGSPLLGAEERVNSYTYGDQYVPQISALGTNYLVAWTSLAQDGSREGVFGQLLNGDGSLSGQEFRVNTTTVGAQMHPAIAANGKERFVAVWTSFGSMASGFDLFAQVYAPPGFVHGPSVATYEPVLYDPFPDPSLIPAPPFPAEAVPVGGNLSNAFAAAQGSYNGLFYNTNGVSVSTAGYINVRATKKGTYSGSIYLAGHSYPISGHFDPLTGLATNTVGKGSSALTVQLQLDLTGGMEIAGQIIGGGNWSADLAADLQAPRKAGQPNGFAGYYIMSIPPASSGGGPEGNGFGSVKVDSSGNVKWTGTLADGTKVSQSSGLSAEGIWALYASPYSGHGTIIGWIQFAANGSLGGNVVWMKPAGTISKSYPGGFTNDIDVAGSFYTKPTVGARLLDWTNGQGSVVFSGGGLLEPLTNTLTLEGNKLSISAGEKMSLSINSSLGTFSGTAQSASVGPRLPFSGVLWPGGVGLGFFLNTNQSGGVNLSPAQ